MQQRAHGETRDEEIDLARGGHHHRLHAVLGGGEVGHAAQHRQPFRREQRAVMVGQRRGDQLGGDGARRAARPPRSPGPVERGDQGLRGAHGSQSSQSRRFAQWLKRP
ncbi:hypothetical protein Ddc_24399 [Ditylenchus destructor]|nr:hypothetical protein Ddc_24399 [Ditylenchus destructor]